jgi:lipoprotein-anchoring transpeptidase ErfK/SrfK
MNAEEARAALARSVERPLSRSLTIRYREHGVLLSSRAAGVEVDIDETVTEALEKSRRGNFLTRSWRDLNGDGVDARVPLEITYSAEVVEGVVANLKKSLYVKPREAEVRTSAMGVEVSRSRDGREVRTAQLERRIAAHLIGEEKDRVVRIPVKVVKPEVTTEKLRQEFSHFIGISRNRFELRLFVNLKLAKVYRISVGQIGYDTPVGLYNIRNKAVNPSWFVPNKPWAGKLAGKVIPPGPDNPIKSRWMGIYNGAGIHGTDAVDSIGRRASHGCIHAGVHLLARVLAQPVGEVPRLLRRVVGLRHGLDGGSLGRLLALIAVSRREREEKDDDDEGRDDPEHEPGRPPGQCELAATDVAAR